MTLRARAWTFTINNYTFLDMERMLHTTFSYLCFGFEVCPTTKTPHIQGYIYFYEARTMSAIKKDLPRAYLEISKGTVKDNQVYTSKLGDEDWYEFGERPSQGKMKWEQIEDVMQCPQSNPHIYNQYNKMYRQLTLSKKKEHDRKFYIINFDDRYMWANQHSSVFLDDDLDVYDGENVLILNSYYSSFRLDNWVRGFPQKIKRGYELICIDPEIVYLCAHSMRDLNEYMKLYGDFISDNYYVY